jgi:hypothetical protein
LYHAYSLLRFTSAPVFRLDGTPKTTALHGIDAVLHIRLSRPRMTEKTEHTKAFYPSAAWPSLIKTVASVPSAEGLALSGQRKAIMIGTSLLSILLLAILQKAQSWK